VREAARELRRLQRNLSPEAKELLREHRRRRFRRHRRRAYIRSVYFLPSLATLGNAICGFAACYVAGFDQSNVGGDPFAKWMLTNKFLVAAYFILFAMLFDALDGRLARGKLGLLRCAHESSGRTPATRSWSAATWTSTATS